MAFAGVVVICDQQHLEPTYTIKAVVIIILVGEDFTN